MNQQIPFLKKGDVICIVAPAKAIEEDHINWAKTYLESVGFSVQVAAHCLGRNNYFSGTLHERLVDFQDAIDDPNVKAILCARGGYGCIQLVDKLQWAAFIRNPKWIIGFSDVTVFHQRAQRLGLESIHGSMPLNFSSNTTEALDTLVKTISGEDYSIGFPSNTYNKRGQTSGILVGGNLSILYSLLGTDDQIDYSGKILFIEDLAEQLYHIDRIFHAFHKAGILDKIKGLIVGGMTDLKDTATPFGSRYEEIILSHFQYKKTPVCFDFPAGHISDNRALILGKEVKLTISEKETTLNYLD